MREKVVETSLLRFFLNRRLVKRKRGAKGAGGEIEEEKDMGSEKVRKKNKRANQLIRSRKKIAEARSRTESFLNDQGIGLKQRRKKKKTGISYAGDNNARTENLTTMSLKSRGGCLGEIVMRG
ncbi:hypothetical protein VTO42DRAFT_1409 [Malbranchea cinnamomea]